MVWYHQVKSNLKDNDKIYFTDGTRPKNTSMPSYGWILKGEKKNLKSNSGKQKLNLLGVLLDVENLNCIVKDYQVLNFESTRELFKEIERKN